MHLFLDFETYWNDDYTLKKLSVEEYVRDPRFEVLCLAVAIDDGPVVSYETPEAIREVLNKLPFSDPNIYTVCHNYQFDGFILSEHFGLEVANPSCTRAWARWAGVSRLGSESLGSLNKFFGLPEKFAGTDLSRNKHRVDFSPSDWERFLLYNRDDVKAIRQYVNFMRPLLTPEALSFISLSELMYTQPCLGLDADLLRKYEAELVARQERAMDSLQRLFKFPDREAFLKAIRGRLEFPAMLRQLGVEPPTKLSAARVKSTADSLEYLRSMVPAVKAGTVSKADKKLIQRHLANYKKGPTTFALAKTDTEFMPFLEHENEDVALLCRTRAENNTSIALSRCRRLLAVAGRGSLPVPLSAFQAQTGRYTGDNSEEISDKLNLQNLNKRTGDKTLRRAILASEGYVLVAADSAQIEARVNAWAWGQTDLVEVFAAGRDPYAEFASEIYNITAEEIHSQATPELMTMRNVGKESILSLGYNAGGPKFAQRCRQNKIKLGITEEEHDAKAQEIVSFYRAKYAAVRQGWKTNQAILKVMLRGEGGSWGGPTGTLFSFNGQDNIFGRPCPTITLPDGFKLYYPGLGFNEETNEMFYTPYNRKLKRSDPKKIYGGFATNHCIQSLSFAIIRWQMAQIAEQYPIVLNVHDEVVALVPEAEAETALAGMIQIMKTVPPWLPGGESLPLNASGGFGRNYAEV